MANATTTRVDSDLDAQSPAADLVRVYLNGIGKTALLNAADEVELAKRIEAGLYAQHLLDIFLTKQGHGYRNSRKTRKPSGTHTPRLERFGILSDSPESLQRGPKILVHATKIDA